MIRTNTMDPVTTTNAIDQRELANQLLVRGHHHRRLRRLGHTSAFEFAAGSGLWAVTDPPPRSGNSVEVLVDGERACGAIARELSGAHSQVHIAGCHLTPSFELTR